VVTAVGWVGGGIEHIRGDDPPPIVEPAPPLAPGTRITNIDATITVTINGQPVRFDIAPGKGWRRTDYRSFKLNQT
jgi:hypothetical protein